MELFDEIYSCNYLAVDKILSTLSEREMTAREISQILDSFGSTLTLRDLREFKLVTLENGVYYTNIDEAIDVKRPLTELEKRWLKSAALDKRAQLFLSDSELDELNSLLDDVPPLYSREVFRRFDSLSGDPVTDEDFRALFRKLLRAVHRRYYIDVELEDKTLRRLAPYKIEYSPLKDEFKLAALNSDLNKMIKLRLADIKSVNYTNEIFHEIPDEVFQSFEEKIPIELEIYNRRNALGRFNTGFSNYHKETSYDGGRDCCTSRIFYFPDEYNELIDTILSFGSTVKVLSPKKAVDDVVARLKKQRELFQ